MVLCCCGRNPSFLRVTLGISGFRTAGKDKPYMRDMRIALPLHAIVKRGVDFKAYFIAACPLCVLAQTRELYVRLRWTQVDVAHQSAKQLVRSASASSLE